jgi:hypothetical protein
MEGLYPSKSAEKDEFRARSLDSVSQTALQKYLLEDLLGIKTQFIFLVQKASSNSNTHLILLWKEVFSRLNLDNSPDFILERINRL